MGNPIYNEEYDRNQCFLPPTTPLDNDSMSLKHYFNPCKEDDDNIPSVSPTIGHHVYDDELGLLCIRKACRGMSTDCFTL